MQLKPEALFNRFYCAKLAGPGGLGWPQAAEAPESALVTTHTSILPASGAPARTSATMLTAAALFFRDVEKRGVGVSAFPVLHGVPAEELLVPKRPIVLCYGQLCVFWCSFPAGGAGQQVEAGPFGAASMGLGCSRWRLQVPAGGCLLEQVRCPLVKGAACENGRCVQQVAPKKASEPHTL